MMKIPIYPLLQVLQVKIRRVEQQEKIVLEKQQALEEEEKRLKEKEEARNKVLDHHTAKLLQLRNELDQQTTSEKVKQMKLYLKEVKIKLEVEEKKVKEQKEKVESAQKEVDTAKIELKRRRVDVDKIEIHKKGWQKEVNNEIRVYDEREEDEMGQIIFSKNHRKK